MTKKNRPRRESLKKVANYLEIEKADIVRYINYNEYGFGYYLRVKARSFGDCILKESFVDELIAVFAYRKDCKQGVDYLESQMKEWAKSDKKEAFCRSDSAYIHIKEKSKNNNHPLSEIMVEEVYSEKTSEYEKWKRKKYKEKEKKIEEKLEGSDISVKVDKMGRCLYYKEKGNWIPHERVKGILNKNEEDENGSDMENEKTFDDGENLPF